MDALTPRDRVVVAVVHQFLHIERDADAGTRGADESEPHERVERGLRVVLPARALADGQPGEAERGGGV